VIDGGGTDIRDNQHRTRSDVILFQKSAPETAVKEAIEGFAKVRSVSGSLLSEKEETIEGLEGFEGFAKVWFVSGTLLLRNMYIGGRSSLCQGRRQEPTPT